MSIAHRFVIGGLPHHVMLRGNNRRRLFAYPTEYKNFLGDVWRAQRRAPVAVHAITLMTNHVSLVVTPRDADTLSRFVHHSAQRYAQLRNARRGMTGKLFQQGFIAIPIESERELAVTLAYVELTPVRAGLCKDPRDWMWSTYGLHVPSAARCGISDALWTPNEWYLGLADDPETRAERYADWVGECHARGEAPEGAERVRAVEALSAVPYTRRLERPNRKRAM